MEPTRKVDEKALTGEPDDVPAAQERGFSVGLQS